MIHDLDNANSGVLPLRPAAMLARLILSECLNDGFSSIRLTEGEAPSGGGKALGVQFLEGEASKDVMKIPVAAGVPLLVHLRSMCEMDPAKHPALEGTFGIKGGGKEAQVKARFGKSEDGTEEAELVLSPNPGTRLESNE